MMWLEFLLLNYTEHWSVLHSQVSHCQILLILTLSLATASHKYFPNTHTECSSRLVICWSTVDRTVRRGGVLDPQIHMYLGHQMRLNLHQNIFILQGNVYHPSQALSAASLSVFCYGRSPGETSPYASPVILNSSASGSFCCIGLLQYEVLWPSLARNQGPKHRLLTRVYEGNGSFPKHTGI